MAESGPDDALRRQQYALARHLRDPAANPAPAGIEDRRLEVYRELFYNGIESLLAGNFPVIRRTLADARWHALVRAFYAGHRCRTPLFTGVGREFIDFLEARETAGGGDPLWLAELAHYEWVELALQISQARAPGAPTDEVADTALLASQPRISPLAWPLAYRWPVHRIGPSFQPEVPPPAPTLLLVRRDPQGQVHFSELSPPAWRLLELLGDDAHRSADQVLRQLAGEAAADDVDEFVAQGTKMLRRLRDEDVLLEGVLLDGTPVKDGPEENAPATGARVD
jgi:uncharacterized protein